MSGKLKYKLLSNEEGKESVSALERRYLEQKSVVTSVSNLNFEMNQRTLMSADIRPKDLKSKIEEYLETQGLTRDQVKLLLKQGAEDNNLFMIKEDTYDKLVDSLGLSLDFENDANSSNISGMLASARQTTQQ